uniref:IRX4 isoform 4 transcript variant 6 n=1 Tax=Homo sapiens TaxID=9606 RepID=A0AAU7B9P2_HUMAN
MVRDLRMGAWHQPLPPTTLTSQLWASTPMTGMEPWTAARGARTPRARPPARSRPGCRSTARTPTPPRARRSCWPSSPR